MSFKTYQEAPQVPEGKPTDFDFLAGEWKINHRRRKEAGKEVWDGTVSRPSHADGIKRYPGTVE